MLSNNIHDFLQYLKDFDFTDNSLETLNTRLNEFLQFCIQLNCKSIYEINYKHLLEFVANFNTPSIDIKKARVWTLRKFYHFLCLKNRLTDNIALQLPYPKINKTEPKFLTQNELNQIVQYFIQRIHEPFGFRNLIIVIMLSTIGIRKTALIKLEIQHVDLQNSLVKTKDKGNKRHNLVLPQMLCILMEKYLKQLNIANGPLFLSKRGKRISERSVQDILKKAADELGIDKRLHPHLFRHTSATLLNKIAGIDITQQVLGHRRRENTEKYLHLNADQFALYMKRHPYHSL